MTKLDLRKELKHLYSPSTREIEVVNVPRFSYVMIDGELDPGEPPAESAAFQDAVGTLYTVSYALKFISKNRERNPIDYPVMPLEGLWWTDEGTYALHPAEPWNFTLMILQPKHITARLFGQAMDQLREKGTHVTPGTRLELYREGLCIQTMHIGAYTAERETMDRMQDFADASAFRYAGKHHEIYMGDPRRSKPERLRTILRQPVAKMR